MKWWSPDAKNAYIICMGHEWNLNSNLQNMSRSLWSHTCHPLPRHPSLHPKRDSSHIFLLLSCLMTFDFFREARSIPHSLQERRPTFYAKFQLFKRVPFHLPLFDFPLRRLLFVKKLLMNKLNLSLIKKMWSRSRFICQMQKGSTFTKS